MTDAGDTSPPDEGPDSLRDDLSERNRAEERRARRERRAEARNSGEESINRGIGGNSARILLYGGVIVIAAIGVRTAAVSLNGTPDKSPVDHLRNDDGCFVDRDGNIINAPDDVGLSKQECLQLENRKHIDSLPARGNSWSNPARATDEVGLTRGLEISL